MGKTLAVRCSDEILIEQLLVQFSAYAEKERNDCVYSCLDVSRL